MTSQAASWRYLAAVAACAGLLAGCKPQADDEMKWARAALERNPGLEIVAVDDEKRMFTVRLKDRDELVTVRLSSLIAGPEASPPASQDATPPAPEMPAAPAAAESAVAEPAATEPSALAAPDDTAAATEAVPEEPAVGTAYVVERSGAGVRVTGPGVSIQTVGPASAEAQAAARVMRGDSAIICEGPRLLRIDGRTLAVSGDAVVARDGCEIHITNSRIDGSRSAITVTGASVHITNSTVVGSFRSLDIMDGGKVFARSSEFAGLVQRQGNGELIDLGGNNWK